MVLGILEVKEVIWEPWVAAAITSWSYNEGYVPQITLYLRYNSTHEYEESEWVGHTISREFGNFRALLSVTHTQEWSGFWMNSKNRCHLPWHWGPCGNKTHTLSLDSGTDVIYLSFISQTKVLAHHMLFQRINPFCSSSGYFWHLFKFRKYL